MSVYFNEMKGLISDEIEPLYSPQFIDFDSIEQNVLSVLAGNLISSRKSAGLSQAKMAKIFSISLTQYKKYEFGQEVLKVDLAQKWSLRFGIPFFYLLKGSEYDLPFCQLDDSQNFKWFLANSLTNEYFCKLVAIVNLFSHHQCEPAELADNQITNSEVSKALVELDTDMYVTIANGLKEFRGRFGICQDDMAEYLGVSKSTYQQYEKPIAKPRFSILIAARFYLSTGVSPLCLLKDTMYSKVRHMQEHRMEKLQEVVSGVDQDQIQHLRPLIGGFFDMVRTTPGAMLI